jgi:UDP-N-acetylmuramoylalanine--D-glutamate ligase
VLGLARSGTAAARLALSRGAEVYVSDLSDSDATRAAAETIRGLGGDVEIGGHDLDKLASCSRIVLSPGIPPTAGVLQAPQLREVPIVPELEIAYGELEGPVVAITGTNGKTTVTALLAHVLTEAGFRAAAGGNIGIALSELVMRDPQPEVAVVEASSFQLGRTVTFAPDIGILTNLSPDHLDWYSTVAEYYADKAKLFQNAGPESRWILNGEDDEVLRLIGDAEGERFLFRAATPPEPGEGGGFLDGEWLTLRLGERDERVVRSAELKIFGPHNVANALAAAIAARLVGAEIEGIAAGLRSFLPMEHRLEPVVEQGGVLWVNDSKATNIASTRVAIRSLDRPIVLLLGGRHKGEDYQHLLPDMAGRVRQVVAYGEAAERVDESLGAHVPVVRVAGEFEEVLRHAASAASEGDAVLLSPACSSYDMFRDYEERGREFRRIVLEGFD